MWSQSENKEFTRFPSTDSTKSSELYLTFQNLNFFKNDEYFGELTSGITYIGTLLQPRLSYQPYKNIKIDVGIHMLKFSGLDGVTDALPVFSFQYQPYKGFDVIMGTINGGLNHQIIEPMYSFENHLMNFVENGAQLLIQKKRFYADVWLNWEKFIFKTSQSQESIVGGIHSTYWLSKAKDKEGFNIDGQLIIAHKGGQFHTEKDVLQTLVNTAIGLAWVKKIKSDNQWGFSSHFLNFYDSSPIPQYPYILGYSTWTQLYWHRKHFSTSFGYWNGDYFISSFGNPLFQSISQKDKDYLQPHTELITAKFILKAKIYQNVTIEARLEPYFDLQQNIFEYSYGFHILFDTEFFLKHLKK
ncbi:MAG: hypothetical protein JXR60_08625 [Bacteroidales bacterium]|nr:hypothetical protein [Bacteroidales bacterium]